MRRYPHVLLTKEEVGEAVAFLLGEPEIVFDLETRGVRTERYDDEGQPIFTDARDPRGNEITWFGLGCAGRNFLIPAKHPKGWTTVSEKRVEGRACDLLDWDDPLRATEMTRHLGPGKWKDSVRQITKHIPPEYAEPPQQLYPHEVAEIIAPLMFSDRAKIGHHLKFDLETVAKYLNGEIPTGPYHDTLVLQHIINENLKFERGVTYSLKDISIDWFRPADPKTWYPEIGKAGPDNFGLDQVARYVAMDLRRCWYLKERLWYRLIKLGLLSAYEFEMSQYPVLMSMEQAGFPINEEARGKVGAGLDEDIAAIEKACWDIAHDQFPLSNTGIKRWLLFGKGDKPLGVTPLMVSQNLRPLSYTVKTRTPQLTQAVLDHYADRNKLAGLFRQYSEKEKLRGTFVKGLGKIVSGTPPKLHTSFKQHGTVTGRFSCAYLHQIPKGSQIRELFVAGDGYVLIVADYDQIELRCAGYESHDPEMLEVFQRGEDVHRSAAAAMFRVTEVTEEQRAVGKTQNFAVLYGAGPNKIAAVAKCSKAEAQRLISRYYATFSGLEPWKRAVLAEARSRYDPDAGTPPYVTIPISNRIRRLPDLLNYKLNEDGIRYRAERQAINAVVQGFAANITKLAMSELHQQLAPFDAQMLLQVHDEIIIRVAEHQADEVLDLTHRCMTGIKNGSDGSILGSIPLIVSAKVGYSWAAGKSK